MSSDTVYCHYNLNGSVYNTGVFCLTIEVIGEAIVGSDIDIDLEITAIELQCLIGDCKFTAAGYLKIFAKNLLVTFNSSSS